jgi:hypothetical protein
MSVPTTTSSATSMNFIGFDEMKGNGTAPLLFNRVVIMPPRRETAGKWIHPAAGFIPGQQPYIKPKVQVYNRSYRPVNRKLARQGLQQMGSYY